MPDRATPVPFSSKTAPMKARAQCTPRIIWARQYLMVTAPRDGSTDMTFPGSAQPVTPLVLGGLWISTWSPTLKRPHPDSVARACGNRSARAIDWGIVRSKE
eukprot:2987202-Pyramimonas_sp.AAC.1